MRTQSLQIRPTYPYGITQHHPIRMPTITQQPQPVIIIQNTINNEQQSHPPPRYYEPSFYPQPNMCLPSACFMNPCTYQYYAPPVICRSYCPVRNFC